MGKYKALVEFIAEEYGITPEKINLTTKIEEDLRITGDDGIDFLEKFIERFSIQYDPNRIWQFYFEPEGVGCINFVGIFDRLRGKKDQRKKYDLTIYHLLKIIESGYWIDIKESKL